MEQSRSKLFEKGKRFSTLETIDLLDDKKPLFHFAQSRHYFTSST